MKRACVQISCAALLSCTALAACVSAPTQEETARVSIAEAQAAALIATLPGDYSNFAQVQADGAGAAVIDVNVRLLSDGERSGFLFSRNERGTEDWRHQFYLLRPAAENDLIELQFAPVSGETLKRPVPAIMREAEQRIRPGCGIPMAATSEGLVGQTRYQQCRFQHPEAGEVGLTREVSFGRSDLVVAERLLDASGAAIGPDAIFRLRKHASYGGWAGVRTVADAPVDDPSAWRLAQPFTIRDDGRVIDLFDAAGDRLDYGLQLAYLGWRTDKPAILRLAVVEIESGKILSYAWGEPGTGQIGLNLDWFQVGLERSEAR